MNSMTISATAEWDIPSRLERLTLLARLSEHQVMSEHAYSARKSKIILTSRTRGLLRIAHSAFTDGLLIALAIFVAAVAIRGTLPDPGQLAIVVFPVLAILCIAKFLELNDESINDFEERYRVLSSPEVQALYVNIAETWDHALRDVVDRLFMQNFMLRAADRDLIDAVLQLYRSHQVSMPQRLSPAPMAVSP